MFSRHSAQISSILDELPIYLFCALQIPLLIVIGQMTTHCANLFCFDHATFGETSKRFSETMKA